MVITLTLAAREVGGRLLGPDTGAPILSWCFDSRLPVSAVATTCFIALDGPLRSGASYCEAMYERGVRQFCVSEMAVPQFSLKPDATYWVVPRSLEAVQQLALVRRKAFTGQVVGITGSNGKTTVKEWLYTLLGGRASEVYRSPGSYNSQLGVALSILAIPISARTAIIEVGVSKQGEMQTLAQLVRPTCGIFTNLGSAHDSGFGSRDAKRAAKWCLFDTASWVVCPAALPPPTLPTEALPKLVRWQSDAVDASQPTQASPQDELVRVSFEPPHFAKFVWQSTGEELQLGCTFDDSASRANFCSAVLAAGQLLSPEALRSLDTKQLSGGQFRLSAFRGRDDCLVVDDSYNADREGLAAALEFFSQQRSASEYRIVVLGSLLDGTDDVGALLVAQELLATADVHEVITVGSQLRTLELAGIATVHVSDANEAIAYLAERDLQQTALLVKGSHREQLGRITEALRRQLHDLRLEINLDALTHNLAAFRERLRPSTKLCVMVKAQAYGSGSRALTRLLIDRGVDYLAVATIDEGIELREAGYSDGIIVANTAAGREGQLRRHALEAEITSLAQLVKYESTGVPLHLKIDTGMHRLGFGTSTAELSTLSDALARGEYNVVSMFSHLSASGSKDADDFSKLQNERLLQAASALRTALGGATPMLHLLNSAGAWRLPQYQHDMVRLGMGLYGLGPAEVVAAAGLQAAHRWVAQLVQLRDVAAGEPVGYGLGGAANVDRRIGVVNVGYADGLRRAAGNGKYALRVRCQSAATVGSICMDFCMIDLNNAREAEVGDEVEVISADLPIGELARCFGTIDYEVLTGIGQRVRRVFYR